MSDDASAIAQPTRRRAAASHPNRTVSAEALVPPRGLSCGNSVEALSLTCTVRVATRIFGSFERCTTYKS